MRSKVLDSGDVFRDEPAPNRAPRKARFVIIEKQRLWQECLSHSIGQLHPTVTLVCCDSIDSYLSDNPPLTSNRMR